MSRFRKLLPNLLSTDLFNGKLYIEPVQGFSCFFIVQHTCDKDFIKDQAAQLLLAGCRDFNFYGEMEPIWHQGFDEADILLNPDSTHETVALTSGWETIDEFVEVLQSEISS